ncbi:GDP-L-fucose synthase [Frankia sp. Cr2]|uniref:GDP-L-fucose synthase family protein n=1 Tax=Frankia sp. Cr2 TaxID=3073932 RepID=UPI002AD5ADC9|nr:GDP-L-fucose synthase [Frankia sp. Cr2]
MVEMATPGLAPGARIYVAGHRGLVGSAITRHLASRGFEVLTRTHAELDLTDADATTEFFADTRPDHVVVAAARVGGIMANSTAPVDFLEDNLRIQLNVISCAYRVGVQRLLFLGSSCIYPKLAPQPITEDALLTGPLEPTNEAYAIAKIAGITQIQAYRRQYGASFVSAMPTNVYGPADNFDLETSHVLPALIRRCHEAKVSDAPEVVLWGTGTPRREFIHAHDLARACLTILSSYDDPAPINVGTGVDQTIREIAELIADVIGYSGRLRFDSTKPDGTPRKLLDVSRLHALGWQPEVPLRDGIQATYEWWLEHSGTPIVAGPRRAHRSTLTR